MNMSAVTHWDYRGLGDESPPAIDYPAARNNLKPDMPDISQMLASPAGHQFLSEISLKYNLGGSVEPIINIFEMLSRFDLRFPLVVDRLDSPNLTLEQLKGLYYEIYAYFWPLKKCKYSPEADAERRARASNMDSLDGQKKKEEKRLLLEIKEIENQISECTLDVTSILKSSPQPSTPKKTCYMASSEKRPIGYDQFINHLPGHMATAVSGELKTVSTHPQSTFVKQNVNFVAIEGIPKFCSNFSSPEIANFFSHISNLLEQEKSLNAFIRKQDSLLKGISKQSS